jgi:predicted nucleic acid-binding Zn ribbon protein
MEQHRRKRNIKMLWALILLGIAYSGILQYQCMLTGLDEVDGIIGVLLGLYICSHPAANMVDMLFYRQGARHPSSSKRSTVLWLALNIVVLLIGWIVIFGGTTRFFSKVD